MIEYLSQNSQATALLIIGLGCVIYMLYYLYKDYKNNNDD